MFASSATIICKLQLKRLSHSLLLTCAKASRYSNVSSGTGSSRRNCLSSVAASCGCTPFRVNLPCLYRDSSSCLSDCHRHHNLQTFTCTRARRRAACKQQQKTSSSHIQGNREFTACPVTLQSAGLSVHTQDKLHSSCI